MSHKSVAYESEETDSRTNALVLGYGFGYVDTARAIKRFLGRIRAQETDFQIWFGAMREDARVGMGDPLAKGTPPDWPPLRGHPPHASFSRPCEPRCVSLCFARSVRIALSLSQSKAGRGDN